MLDIKFIRENSELIKSACTKKQIDPKIVDKLLKVDKKRSELIANVENIRRLKNKANQEIKKANLKEKQEIIEKMKKLDSSQEKELQEIEKEYQNLMLFNS